MKVEIQFNGSNEVLDDISDIEIDRRPTELGEMADRQLIEFCDIERSVASQRRCLSDGTYKWLKIKI